MAVTPYVFCAMNDGVPRLMDRPSSLFGQNFGSGLLDQDLFDPRIAAVPFRSGYYSPCSYLPTRHSGTSHVDTNEGFKVNLDVQQFKSEEVSVKMVDNYVVVEGKHEERKDEHGYIKRHFLRRYLVPSDVDPANITSKLSSNGVLSIEGPKKASKNERVVPIIHTNAPAVTHLQGQGDAKPASEEKEQ